jgi:hypothetical protein
LRRIVNSPSKIAGNNTQRPKRKGAELFDKLAAKNTATKCDNDREHDH